MPRVENVMKHCEVSGASMLCPRFTRLCSPEIETVKQRHLHTCFEVLGKHHDSFDALHHQARGQGPHGESGICAHRWHWGHRHFGAEFA
jgi:hypothetical protein